MGTGIMYTGWLFKNILVYIYTYMNSYNLRNKPYAFQDNLNMNRQRKEQYEDWARGMNSIPKHVE